MGPTKVFWGPMKPTFKFGNVYPPLLLREKMRDLFALVLAARVCLIYLLWGFKGAAPAGGLMLAPRC